MKIKVLKICTALVSLLIGFAIVHSLNPEQTVVSGEPSPPPGHFPSDHEAEITLECVYGTKPYEVHFSAYQRPELKVSGVDYQRAFCEKLPSLGPTLITLDFMDLDIRDRSVALKFIKHDQAEISVEELAVAPIIEESFHPGIPRGLIQSRLDISEVGFYTLVVEMGGGVVSDKEVVRIPFEVGADL